jgi:hypothetical protein
MRKIGPWGQQYVTVCRITYYCACVTINLYLYSLQDLIPINLKVLNTSTIFRIRRQNFKGITILKPAPEG